MPRYKGKTTVELSQIEEFADHLIALAETCRANVQLARQHEVEEPLECTHYATALDGIDSISKFGGAVYTAVSTALMKKSLNPKESIKKTARQMAEAVADEKEATKEAERRRARKKKNR